MTEAEALEKLYASDPADFTKARDALAKELKAAGDAAGAAALKARRKPTQIAWVLNQLARKHPAAIADLVDIGRELAREQRKALRGEEVSGLKSSIERQRKAIQDLAHKTAAMMKELGVESTGHMDEITNALSAALVDPVVGAQLEEGRLEKVPEAAVGFGGPIAPASEPDVAPAPESKPAPRSEPAPKTKADDEAKAARAAKAEAAMAERAAKVEAAKARAAHAKELAAAKAEAKSAEAAAAKAKTAAERAEREARTAIEHAKLLADEAAELAEAATAAAKTLTRLQANAPD